MSHAGQGHPRWTGHGGEFWQNMVHWRREWQTISGFLPRNVDIHSCHLLFDHFQFALIHGPNIPGSYIILFLTTSYFTSITSHIHNWALFFLWLHLFILSGVIFPFFPSSILGTYWPGKFIFQCHILLPFHTIQGLLKARILKCFAIAFSSKPHFIRTLHHDLSVLGGPTGHGS